MTLPRQGGVRQPGKPGRDCEHAFMRVWTIVLVAFVILFAAVIATGAYRHAGEPAPSPSNRQQLPMSFDGVWPLVPAFLKVQPGEVSVLGTAAGPNLVSIPAFATAYLQIRASTQPYRMMRLDIGSSPYAVALSYPPILNPAPSRTPEPLSPSNPHQSFVLPKAGGLITLRCAGPGPCVVSY
jgi:hypothetical protein